MLTITKGVMGLSALLVFLFPWSWFNNENINIKINAWDGGSKYEGTINNKPAVIYVDEDKNISEHHPKPGKIKIVFKDSKQNGTMLVYERNMEDGEISEQDQIYIEKILENVEKFHKENHTYLNIKEKLNNIWKEVNNKKRRR